MVLFPPNYVFLDANGLPLASASVYFYASGTSTPQNTYSNPALTAGTENANPIVLNSAGYSTNMIYGSDVAYKVNVKTSLGVQVTGWPQDAYGVAKPDF